MEAALNVARNTVPHLPADKIRHAIDSGEWTQAAELLAMHQHELAYALRKVDWATCDRGPWLELLLAQRALLGELQAARGQISTALERLNADHRGARAWLRELA